VGHALSGKQQAKGEAEAEEVEKSIIKTNKEREAKGLEKSNE